MNVFDDLREGFIKPLRDSLISLVIYELLQIPIILQKAMPISPNSPFGSSAIISINNSLLFISIFILVTTLIEIGTDVKYAYNKPVNAIFQIVGIIIGTVVFWGSLRELQIIAGGSDVEVILTFIISLGAMIIGIYLRHIRKIRKN